MPKSLKWNVFHCDAGKWNKYDEYNIFYIYNSFPKVVMQEVKEMIEKSIESNPRRVKIWYLNPQYPEVFLDDKKNWKLEKRRLLRLRGGMHIFTNMY